MRLAAAVGLTALMGSGAFGLAGARASSGSTGSAGTPVPHGFVGMNADGPLFSPKVDLTGQLKKMAASGVQRVRVDFDWASAQRYATCSQAPGGCNGHPYVAGPGGVPTNFTYTDELVGLAAKEHLQLLPVVLYSPSWDASPDAGPVQPARYKPYGQYLTALVKRYGPHGTFWSANPTLPPDPLTAWQVWNEPDLSYYWGSQPFAHTYVSLLKVAYRAIKHADPSATVVLGALTNYGWRDLASVYRIHGSRKLFNAVAADVYTAYPKGVLTILNYYRRVMAQNGDRSKPIIATEVGWPSDRGAVKGSPPFSTTEKGQATKLARLLPLLAKNRRTLRLSGFFYYTWLTTDQGGPRTWYFYSGLLRFDHAKDKISPKPAYWAFRRTVRQLEG